MPNHVTSQSIARKRKNVFTTNNETVENTNMIGTEHHGKRNKTEVNLQNGYTMYTFKVNSEEFNGKDQFMRSFIEQIISNLPVNKNTRVASFNSERPAMITIPLLVSTVGENAQERFFW